ncbi:MAG: carboxypeptidase regulatory-like domain-containing protein [Bryobacteraceae bacterium]
MKVLSLIALLLILPGLPLSMTAQTTAGSITGTLLDPTGAVVSGASVVAVNTDQNARTETKTDDGGRFVFPMLPPGHYSVTAESSGFKKLERLNVVLNANSVVPLGNLQLEVGAVTSTVQVEGQGLQVQTETAQRGDTIVGIQVENIQVNGQSPLTLLRLLPGVNYPDNQAESGQQFGSLYVNGSRSGMGHITVNGGTNEDTGANSGWMAPVSLDSIQEVNVLTSNYQAEYGRSGGAQVNLITKSGTSVFHGSGFEYFRDKGLNANNWVNNRIGLPTPDYHYNDFGFTVGGPVYIPRKFNSDKSKLFFFWSEEWHRQLVPSGGQVQMRVPTAAERQGDFSSSVDQNGLPILIRDPQSNLPCSDSDRRGCFSNNVIPQSRLYAPGVNLLNLLPAPNAVDPSHPSYNYVSQFSASHPRREDLIRGDYNLSDKWRMYASILRAADNESTPYGIWGMTNIPLYDIAYSIPGYHYLFNVTTTISPTAINEITIDRAHDGQYYGQVKGSNNWTRAQTGVELPTLYSPYQDLIAGFSFGGSRLSNSPYGNFSPFFNANTTTEVMDNFSKRVGAHLLKFGGYYLHNWKVQPAGGDYSGTYNFGDNSSNPFDTNFGFSNAALGVYNNFVQGSTYFNGYPVYNQFEFYVQDSWKVRPRLTLDYGVRFYYLQPAYNGQTSTANFFPQSYDPAQAPVLIRPTLVNGETVGVDPTTGTIYPSVNIGAMVPGTGNSLNGLKVLGKDGVSKYITKGPGVLPAPRFGLAWDVTGRQNVVLRAGGGMFVDRLATDGLNNPSGNPPNVYRPTVYYGLASNLTQGTPFVTPTDLSAWSYNGALPTVYNYSVGIQTKLPWSTVLDVSYVGSLSRHLAETINANHIPFGAEFLAGNQDPTLVATRPDALPGSNALQPQFLRPYQGYGNIWMSNFGANANYNSLQVSVNRRYASGAFIGAAYTFSKCMDITDDNNTIRWDQYTHMALYGPCGYNPTQNLSINYVYPLPRIPKGSALSNRFTRAVLNDWQLSGFTSFVSGRPYSPGFSVSGVSNDNFTGTPDWGPQLLCVGNPTAGTTGGPYDRLNAAAFALPPLGSLGLGCSRNSLWGPGINNWDMSLQKNVVFTERTKLLLRVEAFNVFNHTQFNGINSGLNFSSLTNPTPTNLPFDSSGQLVNTGGFGSVSGVRDPRILQLVAKFVF